MSDKIQTKSIVYLLRNRKSGFSIQNVFMPTIMRLNAPYYTAPCEHADWRSILTNLRWVRRVASKHGINHMTGGPHYFLLAIPFHRNVLTVHDLVLLHNSTGLKRLIFLWFWFRLPIRSARMVTCISNTVRDELIATLNVSPDKVVTIYNPVPPQFQYMPHVFDAVCPRILHIGTAWNKNTERVVQALSNIRCHLIIVGKLTQSIENALSANHTDYEVLRHPTNEELYQQYVQADIISFPSIFEGFGMPIIEGQATGRPVLTSDIAPMTEVAGNGACFANPHDTTSIRNGFLKIINDEDYRNEIVRMGLDNVKRFSAEKIAEQYKTIYQDIYENRI